MTDIEVAIVGGGISGLIAARELCRSGFTVRLFERDDRCGGVIRTETIDGFVIDAGPDTLVGHKPAAIAMCHELDLGASLMLPLPPPTTYVMRNGRPRALPETSAMGLPTDWKALATTRAFSWPGKLRMAAEPLMPRAGASDESITSFVGRRFGNEAVTYLAEPLLAGLHRGDAARLSMRALFPALAAAEANGSIVRLFRQSARGGGRSAGSMSLRGGLGQLVERLRTQLPPDVIVPRTEVESIDHSRLFVTRLANGHVVRSRVVILALPAPAVGAVVGELDSTLARLCGEIRCASNLAVALGYRREDVRHAVHGWRLVVPVRERRHLADVTWVTSRWPHRAPPDHVLIRGSVCGIEAMEASDDQLREWAQHDLRSLFGIRADPVVSRVYQWPGAVPQLEVGHLDRIATIERRLSRLPGLFISAGGFRGVGIADCIENAQATARRAACHLERRPPTRWIPSLVSNDASRRDASRG